MIKRIALLLVGLLTAAGLVALAPASPAHAADHDCSDFSNQAQAQQYFLNHGGPSSDPERLDADGDGIACESLPCPCSNSTNNGGGGGSSTPARQHSSIRIKKTEHGPHGWKVVATVRKNGTAWKHKRTVLQAKMCGSFEKMMAKRTGPRGHAVFVLALEKGWNKEKVCGVKYSHLPFRVHAAKEGKVPAASSRKFHVVRR